MDLIYLVYGGVLLSPVILYFLRQQFFMNFRTCQSPESLVNKTVLVTGANTGLGKRTALECAKRKARVILACRNLVKGEEAANEIRNATKECGGGEIIVRKLDLCSLDSVRKFCSVINKEETRLDILVNNAGIFRCPYSKTEDGFEMHLGVNHLGHFLLTHLLLDLMKKSTPARIVILASFLYKSSTINFDDLNWEKSYNRTEAYSASKLANVLFGRELHRKLANTGINVYLVDPGVVRTNIMRHSIPRILSFLDYIFAPFFKTIHEGVQTTLHCILSKELDKQSGLYYTDCKEETLNSTGLDETLAKKLWDYSAKVTGIEITPK